MMTAEHDPFERAAKREHIEEARREAMAERVKRRTRRGSEEAGNAFSFFFLPYIVWALLRASNHVWAHPYGHSIVRFFFSHGFLFAAYTVWLLFLGWMLMIGPD
ncbi:MAG: hypothetical protein ABR552_11305 [Actinomycetota bacterium]